MTAATIKATPPKTPTTIPAIDPPLRPESLSLSSVLAFESAADVALELSTVIVVTTPP
jgi:hypothetical protein